MTSLSLFTFSPPSNDSSFHLRSHTRTQRVILPKKWRCSASEQPQQQQRHHPKKEKSQTEAEKGIDPVGFLTKLGISHKPFAQFLRERYKSVKDLKDEIFNRHLNLKEMSSGYELLGMHRNVQHRVDFMQNEVSLRFNFIDLAQKCSMNATLCNLYPVFSLLKKSSSPSPCPNSSSSRRNPNRFRSQSLVIETAEGQVSEETRSESVARRLILLRHAKSSWEDPSLRDHDRPLSKAGQADAVNVAHKLQQLGWIPELILSSDAVRTRETLKIMQEQVRSFLEAEVHFISSFYSIAAMDGQTAEHLQQAICKFSRDEMLTVMCMGHNRGWEEAASMFSGASVELKTCNAALLEATGKSWEEAFALAGIGGWKLQGIVRPNGSSL